MEKTFIVDMLANKRIIKVPIIAVNNSAALYNARKLYPTYKILTAKEQK